MLYKYAKEDIKKYCDKHYECTTLKPTVKKDKFFKVVDRLMTPSEKRVMAVLWSKNPATGKQYTTREAATVLGYSQGMVTGARQDVILKTVRPLHGLMDYHNKEPLKLVDKSNRIEHTSISLQYYNSAEDIKSTIKFTHTGKCKLETEHCGKTVKREIKHSLSFEEFEKVCKDIDDNPLDPPVHRREEDGDYLRMVTRNGVIGCNLVQYFVDKNINTTPIKYIRKLENAIDEAHPFFSEINKKTDEIEIQYTSEIIFGKYQIVDAD